MLGVASRTLNSMVLKGASGSVLVTSRMDICGNVALVSVVTLLFSGYASVSERATMAKFVSIERLEAAATTVMFATELASNVPMSHVTKPLDNEHAPWDGVAETKLPLTDKRLVS